MLKSDLYPSKAFLLMKLLVILCVIVVSKLTKINLEVCQHQRCRCLSCRYLTPQCLTPLPDILAQIGKVTPFHLDSTSHLESHENHHLLIGN